MISTARTALAPACSAIACWPSMREPASACGDQLVHDDLWDYDPATAPKLPTVRHDGKPVDIVAQPPSLASCTCSTA
jgi:hypothetical protein